MQFLCHLKFPCYKWDLFACGFCAPEWFGHCSLQTAKVIWATWLWADWCCALGVGWTQLATAITEVKSTEHISSIEWKMDVRQSRLCNASRRKAQLTITPPAHSLSSKQEAITQDGHMSRIQGSPTTERWDSFWYWPIWTCVSGLTILHHSYFLFWARPFTGLV